MLRTDKKEKGFTFLEVMIAVFVLTVGIVAAYLASQAPIFYTQNSINRLTASFLAQEGIEIVRNIRDNNWVKGAQWHSGLVSDLEMECPYGGSKYCYANYDDSSLSVSSDPPFLRLNDFFNSGSGNETKFKRKIKINNRGQYLDIKSIVEWDYRGKSYEIKVEDKLYSWWDI
jgi:prepilin-type N-terminal cleavage/methylation domain-containing protein